MFMAYPSSLRFGSPSQEGTAKLPPEFNIVKVSPIIMYSNFTENMAVVHSKNIYFMGDACLRCGTVLKSGKALMGKVGG